MSFTALSPKVPSTPTLQFAQKPAPLFFGGVGSLDPAYPDDPMDNQPSKPENTQQPNSKQPISKKERLLVRVAKSITSLGALFTLGGFVTLMSVEENKANKAHQTISAKQKEIADFNNKHSYYSTLSEENKNNPFYQEVRTMTRVRAGMDLTAFAMEQIQSINPEAAKSVNPDQVRKLADSLLASPEMDRLVMKLLNAKDAQAFKKAFSELLPAIPESVISPEQREHLLKNTAFLYQELSRIQEKENRAKSVAIVGGMLLLSIQLTGKYNEKRTKEAAPEKPES